MEFLTTTYLIQLIAVGLLLVIAIFIINILSIQYTAAVMVIFMPFQPLEFSFGTSTLFLIYGVFIFYAVARRPFEIPFATSFGALICWMIFSTAVQHPSTYSQHLVYIYTFIGAVLAFWVAYNAARKCGNPLRIIDALLFGFLLVAVYCVVQLTQVGEQPTMLLGVQDFAILKLRDDGRLLGPFSSAEISGFYFVCVAVLAYIRLLHTARFFLKTLLIAVICLAVVLLLATGSRGETIALFVAFFSIFLLTWRRFNSLAILNGVGAIFLVALVSFVLLESTGNPGIVERFAATKLDSNFVPATREIVWSNGLELARKKPIFGHGPRMRFTDQHLGNRYAHQPYVEYPHSLYLFLIYTLGVPGLLFFIFVNVLIAAGLVGNRRTFFSGSSFDLDFRRAGLILLILFLLLGIKIDQTRLALSDFWFLWFSLLGFFLGRSELERPQLQMPHPLIRTGYR